MFNPALQVSGNWPWLIQRPRVKNSLFHLVTLCLTAWLPFSCSAHMGHTVSTEEFKEPKAASLSFPLINTMVSYPSCSSMHITILQCIQQNNIMNRVSLSYISAFQILITRYRCQIFSLADGLYVFDLTCSLSLHKWESDYHSHNRFKIMYYIAVPYKVTSHWHVFYAIFICIWCLLSDNFPLALHCLEIWYSITIYITFFLGQIACVVSCFWLKASAKWINVKCKCNFGHCF